MGLDMSLSAEVYIGGEYEHREVTGKVNISIKDEPIDIAIKDIESIRVTVGYWRKANAIHNWFVNNCQDGVDDCRTAEVSMENLIQLKNDCLIVLSNPDTAEDYLATTSGFFFGNTDYDEYYVQTLNDTVEIVQKAEEISNRIEEHTYVNFSYSSSW